MLLSPPLIGGLGPHNSPVVSGYAGQPSNPVGFAHAPGFSSLTPFTGSLISGTSGAHQVYSFKDFNSGNFPNLTISGLTFVDFIGCRFQSAANSPHPAAQSSSNILFNSGSNITFSYCSWTPLASKYLINPNYGSPTAAWPASGAGHNTVTQIAGTNAIAETDAYTYGLVINSGGPISLSHCEFWGYGNAAIDWASSTSAAITVDNCWIHDSAASGNVNNEHQDALGYLNDGHPPSNITISNCTIAGIGNTNALAWQGGTATFNNINHVHNYLSGYGYTALLSTDTTGIFTNSQFINNVFGTDLQNIWGFLFQFYQSPQFHSYGPMFSGNGNTWSGNIVNVVAGTTISSTSSDTWTTASNGLFLLPDSTYSHTDF